MRQRTSLPRSTRPRWSTVWLAGIALCFLASESTSAQTVEDGQEAEVDFLWFGADGNALPFSDAQEAEVFLQGARVVSSEELSGGTTLPLKVLLEHQGVEAHAVFRHVDLRHPRVKVDGRIHHNFHDSYRYECAAFRLSQRLGIDNVPPCVERRIDERDGTLQLWIEGANTEKGRRDKNLRPPFPMRWAREKQTMRLFDSLIANIDRNQGNMLLDGRGKLWFIDHTRSFGPSTELVAPEKIVWCDRRVWRNLQTLEEQELISGLAGTLSKPQVRALLNRRDKLLEHLRQRIRQFGEAAVLFDLQTPSKDSANEDPLQDHDFPVNTSLPDIGG